MEPELLKSELEENHAGNIREEKVVLGSPVLHERRRKRVESVYLPFVRESVRLHRL
jgi:hypothetical protein